jgi:hypothetical protein
LSYSYSCSCSYSYSYSCSYSCSSSPSRNRIRARARARARTLPGCGRQPALGPDRFRAASVSLPPASGGHPLGVRALAGCSDERERPTGKRWASPRRSRRGRL